METGKELTKFQVSEEDLIKFLDVFGQAKLSPQEKTQFLQISKAFGLNPFKREIHLIKYGNEFSIVVGYETYIKRADASGLLGGWKCWTEGDAKPIEKVVKKKRADGTFYDKKITVFEGSLKACIQIIRKDWKEPFYHEVYLSEYAKDNEFWSKPITMLKKVCTSQGFRLCFTEFCGGLPYTEEESQVINAEVLSSEPLELSDDQKQALELLETAIIDSPEMYKKIEKSIKEQPEKITGAIEYLKSKQPKEQEQPEVKEPESEQPKAEDIAKAEELTERTIKETQKGKKPEPEPEKDEFMTMDEITGDKPDNIELDKQLNLFDNSKTEEQ